MRAEPEDDLFVMVLENVETGQIRGTCQMFSRVGSEWPFYSYRISTLTQTLQGARHAPFATSCSPSAPISTAAPRSAACSSTRTSGRAGSACCWRAAAISSSASIASASPARVLAELRGVIDEAGASPFWDGIAGRFFGMSFQEADEFNAIHGTQFIADLMPKTPDLHLDAARERPGR